jgi:type II secretory ATPase GspE/PulE/Tfp pilus assembly ATPase PilB-like protein
MQELVIQDPSYEQLYKQAYKEGMIPMLFDAAHKVNAGQITWAEMMRLCGESIS